MNISYIGRMKIESWNYHKECTVRRFDPKSNPQAQIFYHDKEQSMFDFIDRGLKALGYNSSLFGDGDTTWAYYVVEDREEYNDFKELYLELKQQYKEQIQKTQKSHTVSNKVYAVFIITEGEELYYSRTPVYEQAETCVKNLAKRGINAIIKEWKGEEQDDRVRNYL